MRAKSSIKRMALAAFFVVLEPHSLDDCFVIESTRSAIGSNDNFRTSSWANIPIQEGHLNSIDVSMLREVQQLPKGWLQRTHGT